VASSDEFLDEISSSLDFLESGDFMGMGLLMKEVGVSKG
jgi:hypothetical protein